MAEAPSQQRQQQAAEPLQAWANFWITPSLHPWSTIPRVPPARGGLISHLAAAWRRGGTSPLCTHLSICDTTSLIGSSVLAGPVHRAHKTFGAWLFLMAPACTVYLRPPCTSSAPLFSAGAFSSSSALDGGGVRPHHLRAGLTFSHPLCCSPRDSWAPV